MKVYRVFASVFDRIEFLQSDKNHEITFETDTVSKLFTVEAKSLSDAINSFMNSAEFKTFSFQTKCFFYYLDDEGNLH